jgi:TrmH family RNA methyltransferase
LVPFLGESRANPMQQLGKAELKRLRALKTEHGREQHRLFVAEGYRLVRAALEASAAVTRIVMTPEFAHSSAGKELSQLALGDKGIPLTIVEERVFRDIAATTHAQGVAAIVRMPGWPSRAPWQSGLTVALYRVRDPGNLGTIWRSAAWFGADRLVLSKGCVDPHNPKAVRATMGGIFYVPCEPVEDLANWLAAARAAGYRILAADVRGESDRWPADAKEAVLVAGGETEPLDPSVLRVVETTLRIPCWGAGDSLNVAMAVSILLDEWRRSQGDQLRPTGPSQGRGEPE